MTLSTPFGAYDIRGRVPAEFNVGLARRIGAALVRFTGASEVALGRDARTTSDSITAAVADGAARSGADVVDLGLCGAEQLYFATAWLGCGAGAMVTASHNPGHHNGMKLVREGARPIGAGDGLEDIARLSEAEVGGRVRGRVRSVNPGSAWRQCLWRSIETLPLRPLKVVVNSGHGAAGPSVEALAAETPLELVHLRARPDGRFPGGAPDPLSAWMRAETSEAVRRRGADMGVALDGDFDRCCLFDERGDFVEPYYSLGILAASLVPEAPHGEPRVVHGPALVWDTEEQVRSAGGRPLVNRVGHSFMKRRMRDEDAVYGGEASGHHYFRDFMYCDSGMIPWLRMAGILSAGGPGLAARVSERRRRYPISGEINLPIAGATRPLFDRLTENYAQLGGRVEWIDGLSIAFADWRFNLRAANTEPLVRLSVETRGDPKLLEHRLAELRRHIASERS